MLSDRFQLSPQSNPSLGIVLQGRSLGELRLLCLLPRGSAEREGWTEEAEAQGGLARSPRVLEVGRGSAEDERLGIAPGQGYLLLGPQGLRPAPPARDAGAWDAAGQRALLDQALAHLAEAEALGLELGALP